MSETIIISDIHLGSEVSQAKNLINFFETIETKHPNVKQIIINGDLFDSWDFRKLKRNHWRVLSHIRKLSKKLHFVWINGNHDGPAEIISHLLGVDFVEKYTFTNGGKKILVLHGDIFDNFIVKYPIFTKLADNIYRLIQKLDKSFYLAKLAKRNSKTFLRCQEKVKEKAKIYCKKQNCDVVCCGHTHFAVADGNYYNSGCWTEDPCTYLLVINGEIIIKNYPDNPNV
jgi:UDP-2,3-diacylglucosamine pyrophosphatase LpxH